MLIAIPRWRNEVKKYKGKGGSPMLLIITSSAVRAININKYENAEKHYPAFMISNKMLFCVYQLILYYRTSSDFKAKCHAITLFAKHYKVLIYNRSIVVSNQIMTYPVMPVLLGTSTCRDAKEENTFRCCNPKQSL